LADIPSPESAGPDLQTRPRQRPQEGVLTPRDLAAAFSLRVDPNIDGPGSRHRRPGDKRMLLAAAILAIMGTAAAAIYLVTPWRERVLSWMQEASPPASAAADSSGSPQQRATPLNPPDWAMAPPSNAPPVDSGSSSDNTSSANKSSPVPAGQPSIPSPSASDGGSDSTYSNSDPGTSAAAAAAERLRQKAGTDLDTLAMQLRNDGMDAESRQDFISAEYFYHQVESLPRDHWPGDIQQLLQNVEHKIQSNETR
jgi:hypothetical protein